MGESFGLGLQRRGRAAIGLSTASSSAKGGGMRQAIVVAVLRHERRIKVSISS
jgi:hypothetical protein